MTAHSQPHLDGLDLKAAGQAAVIASADETWTKQWWATLGALAATGQPFTSEDIIAKIGLPTGDVGMNRNNAVGAMMTAASTRKIIRKTGTYVVAKRPSSHGAVLAQWVGHE